MKIKQIQSIQIINSRGIPTLKTYVILDTGEIGWSMVPQGASRGKKEAVEVYDQDKDLFSGFSLKKNIELIEGIISNGLKGMSVDNQEPIDIEFKPERKIQIKLANTLSSFLELMLTTFI